MTPLVPNYVDLLESLSLKKGLHGSREQGVCVMEAAAWIGGREHTDSPPCVCPVITAFLQNWNDAIPEDETRDRLLKPLIPLILDTKSTKAVEERRAYMAMDWFIREHVPAWFDLTPALKPSGDALRAMDEITTPEALRAAGTTLDAARVKAAAARAGARDAARAAAWDAAWDAARAAAWDAARAAARDAARAAAWDAAWAALKDALKPTTERLQLSAVELVKRMAAYRGES